MKANKYIGIMMLAAAMLTATSCTDYSDYNAVPSAGDQPGANSTLWENISSDTQLTKFADLAKKCNFSEVLNSPRFFTLWAPVDNAISDAEYKRLMESDSVTIVKQFMQQHMTEYNYPVSEALDSTTIISLNAKHHAFTQKSFDGIGYVPNAINLPSTNGVMHKINGMSEFHQNLYENIDSLTGCDLMKNYIQKYDEYYLDVNASVVGPLRDGKQTYLDSVMRKRNNVIRSIMRADLDHEDSTYCMIVPNDKAWNDAYAAIKPCYNYIPKMDYMDLSLKSVVASSTNATTAKAAKAAEADSELQDSLTCRNMVSNLVFSNAFQRNHPLLENGAFAATDSAFTTSGRYLTNMQKVMNHTTSVNEMSNGVTRIVDSLTFNPWQTYNPTIVVTRPAQTMKVKKLTKHSVYSTSNEPLKNFSIFSKVPEMFHQWLFPDNSPYFNFVAVDSADVDGTTGKPEFNFALGTIGNNGTVTGQVRSATYHIYVVTVPEQLINPQAAVKPYYLRFYLSYTDEKNKQQYIVLPKGAKTTSKITTADGESTATQINIGDPDKVNVIDLGEFTFPACYYGLDAYPSLMMMHTESYTSSGNRAKYDQQMRVAGVFLVPKEYNDMWANTNE